MGTGVQWWDIVNTLLKIFVSGNFYHYMNSSWNTYYTLLSYICMLCEEVIHVTKCIVLKLIIILRTYKNIYGVLIKYRTVLWTYHKYVWSKWQKIKLFFVFYVLLHFQFRHPNFIRIKVLRNIFRICLPLYFRLGVSLGSLKLDKKTRSRRKKEINGE
jgi:hypothetical protein